MDSATTERKLALRREMRAMRRELPDQAERSDRIWAKVTELPSVVEARVVMAFSSVLGEPDTAPFVAWCRAAGKQVLFPESEPAPDPSVVDVVIVPGTAFTAAGDRLGQGGGWYDRFLGQTGPDCVTIGVCFAPQLVDQLPVEPHDVRLELVVTDEQIFEI